MKLTSKTNGRFFWRESGNRFFVEIDSVPYELKYTLAQNEAYLSLLDEDKRLLEEKKSEIDETVDLASLLKRRTSESVQYAVKVVHIAMNSKRDQKYSREQVLELFSDHLDLLSIISATYVDKKIFNPSLEHTLDPQLAPLGVGAK